MLRKTLIGAAAALLAIAPALAVGSGRDARVRAVHASPDAPAVDVLVEGSVAFGNLAFGETTPYAALRAGEYDVEVVPAGLSGPVVIDLTGPGALNLFYNRDYTVVALNRLADIEPLVLRDDNRPVSRNRARVRFVHASPDAPAVDIAVTGGPVLFENVAFRGVGDYVEVPAGSYDLEVRPAGSQDVVLSVPGLVLEGATVYTVFAMGTLEDSTLSPVVFVDSESPSRSGNGKWSRSAPSHGRR